MREHALPLHARWATRPGITPGRFIYLAGHGARWRVHASVNSTDGSGKGTVLTHTYFRDKARAVATVQTLIAQSGLTADDWQEFPAAGR